MSFSHGFDKGYTFKLRMWIQIPHFTLFHEIFDLDSIFIELGN
jgi:hypothetical protein